MNSPWCFSEWWRAEMLATLFRWGWKGVIGLLILSGTIYCSKRESKIEVYFQWQMFIELRTYALQGRIWLLSHSHKLTQGPTRDKNIISISEYLDLQCMEWMTTKSYRCLFCNSQCKYSFNIFNILILILNLNLMLLLRETFFILTI